MVYLTGKDWQARALIRAQLLEEGVEVEAFQTPAEALEGPGELLPDLLVADLTSSENPAADCDTLAQWVKQVPIWIVAARNLIADRSLKGRGFEMIFYKPVDVGELVEQIKRRVEELR